MRSCFPILSALPLLVALPARAMVTNQGTGAQYVTLADAIAAASSGDTLVLDPGVYNELVTVDRTLTIDGGGTATMESSVGVGSLIEVTPSVDLTLRGVTLSSMTRRGINGQGANFLTLTDVVFRTQAAGSGGGVLAFLSSGLELTDVTFDRTTAGLDGGGLYMIASALVPVTLTDVHFVDTAVTGATGDGGAMRVSFADLQCTRCSFDGTSAQDGGAVYDVGNSTLVFRDSSFTETIATGIGGAIRAASPLDVRGSLFCGPGALQGGGIHASAGGTIANSSFVGGDASGGGAAIYAQTVGTWSLTNNTVLGSTGDALSFSSPGVQASVVNNAIVGGTGFGVAFIGATATRLEYNLFDGNAWGDVTGAAAGAGTVHATPALEAYSADGDCANDLLAPAHGSPLLDAGDPAILDPDGGRSDIGAYGGPEADPAVHADEDGDGSHYLFDCDEADPSAYPGAAEVCDLVDNDCDGAIDDAPVDIDWWYPDCDGDGQGATNAGVYQCFAPAPDGCAWVSSNTVGDDAWADCDDADATVFYGADERCDLAGVDSNCDGDPDLGAIDAPTWYVDADGDSFGDQAARICAFGLPPGHAESGGDCDDTDATFHPGALDDCGDGLDQDCNGGDGDGLEIVEWYPDDDHDGFGDPDRLPVMDCADRSADHTPLDRALDCDDADAAVHPDALESCNDTDDDCDGDIDEVGPVRTWYEDLDGDGHGDERFPVDDACAPGGAWTPEGGDCADDDPRIFPGADELCNHVDDDCDELLDAEDPDVADAVEAWVDWDGDRYGACPDGAQDCDPHKVCVELLGEGYADNGLDCDDGSDRIGPQADEIVGNTVDEDCDGVAQGERGGTVVPDGSGCNCATAPSPAGGLLVAPLAVVLRRRR